MKMDIFTYGSIFLIWFLAKGSTGQRLHEQIYSSIEGGAACFRRLNGTHQAGCSSSDKGAVGVVQTIHDISDAQWVVYNATAGPYMAVVSTWVFNSVVDLFMTHPKNIAGVLLYDNYTQRPTSFSEESRCPNEYSSAPGSQCSSSEAGGLVWNPYGTGLLRRDIPFPIFFLPSSKIDEISSIEKCYKRYNLDKDNQKGKPLCSIQLHSFMYAAVNSKVCLRRSATTTFLTPTKVCDPLGDHNVYYSLFPRAKETSANKKPVILVTARIDSASLFDNVAPGTSSSAIGLVTFITAAELLAKMMSTTTDTYSTNVLWTLLNGEVFDYIGSQRVAYDIKRGVWPSANPLSPSDIRLHIEIGQIGGGLALNYGNTSWPMYAFTANELTQINDVIDVLSLNLNKNNLSMVPKFTTNLPPSSLHSFRRILKNATESGELPELLLADYEDSFTNMYYQSALDDNHTVNFVYHNISIDINGTFISTEALINNGTMKDSDIQVKISHLATAVAQTLYQKVTNTPYSGSLFASAHLVDEMLYCFLNSQSCRLLMAAEFANNPEDSIPEKPTPLYVGVAAWTSTPAVFAGHLLALLTGTQIGVNHTACDTMSDPDYTYYWLRGWNHTGVCMQTTMNFSAAVSPAFLIPDYDLTSSEYSTWTESVWQSMWARLFVSAGGQGSSIALSTGVIATIIAFMVTFWLRRHADVVFNNSPTTSINNGATTGILRTVNC